MWHGYENKIVFFFFCTQTRNKVLASAAIVCVVVVDAVFMVSSADNCLPPSSRLSFCLLFMCLFEPYHRNPKDTRKSISLVCLSTSFKRACAKTSINTEKSQGPPVLTPLLTLSFRRRPFFSFSSSFPPRNQAGIKICM